MVITKTPLRISFFGGGTDMERFWSCEEGCVLSCTINKYIYVIVRKSFDNMIHIKSFEHERVNSVDDIIHDLIRESMRKAGINGGVEVTVLSDIPHTGSGLGSSSTLTVGLLNAFYTYIGEEVSVETLAQEACEIEIQVLGKPIGKQDQYIAAYGGLRIISFKTDGSVQAEHVNGEYDIYNAMQKHSLLFYTGVGRKAECILAEQSRLITDTRPILRKMRDQVAAARDIIAAGNIGNLGELLKEGWKMKIQLADGISNSRISQMIERAIDAGASGAKITGAGGGGFLLVFCEPEKKDLIRAALGDLKEFDLEFEKDGTKVLLND